MDEGITFHIPDTWVKEVGDQGEYAFISGDGSIFMTAMFMGLDATDDTPLAEMLQQATDGITEAADFVAPPINHANYVARHIAVQGQNMLFAMTDGIVQHLRVIANLFFKTQSPTAFEENRALMEEIISRVEIKG